MELDCENVINLNQSFKVEKEENNIFYINFNDGRIYLMNQIGYFILENIDNNSTNEIVDKLVMSLKDPNSNVQEIKNDVTKFLASLLENNLISVKG